MSRKQLYFTFNYIKAADAFSVRPEIGLESEMTVFNNNTSSFKVVITNNDIDKKNIDARFEGSATGINGNTTIANGRFRIKIRP